MSGAFCPKLSTPDMKVACQTHLCQNWITVYDRDSAEEIQDCAFNIQARAGYAIYNELSRMNTERAKDKE